MDSADLNSLVESLKVPSSFSVYSRTDDEELITRLEKWKDEAQERLGRVQEMALENSGTDLTLRERAQVISAVAVFDGNGPWISPRSLDASRGILASFPQPPVPLLEVILQHHIKPLFLTNPHPSLNLSTGRKLSRPAGGPMASQDYYEGQTWKEQPGVDHLVLWCLRNIQSADYEKLWHLVMPPVMTFLDDYEAPYKLRGIALVGELLKRVPGDLLGRTGVDGLLFSSLNNCLHYLQNPETPAMIRAVVPIIVTLVHQTTPPESAQRFERLSALLGDGIIGSVWLYCSNEAEVLTASVDVLPLVVTVLGIGSARYLKALIPQLVYPLLNSPNVAPVRLRLGSVRALGTVIDECAPRVHGWKGTILEGIGRCWVSLKETESNDIDSVALKGGLRDLCDKMKTICPSVMENEYRQMKSLDTDVFADLM